MASAGSKATDARVAKFCSQLAHSRYPGINLSRVRFAVKPRPGSFFRVHNGRRTVVLTIQVHMLRNDGTFNGEWMQAFQEGMLSVIDCLQNQVRCTEIMKYVAS